MIRTCFLFVCALALALLASSSCKTPEPTAEWQSGDLAAESDHVLWEVTVIALEKEGFPVGSGLDPATMVATSGWKTSLSPFKGQGWRAEAVVKYDRVAPGRYKVDVRVKKELNQNLAKPLDPQYAEWEAAPDDLTRAQVLLQRIHSYLGSDIEVSNGKPATIKK